MSRLAMWLSIAAIVALVAVTWIATEKSSTPAGDAAAPAADEEQPHAAIGAPARFDLTLKNLDGADVELASFKGKVMVVNFWATWCGPCKGEIPDLATLQREHGDDLVVLGVVVLDSFGDKVRTMASELGVNYPVLDGNNRDDLERAYGPFWGLPTSVVVGRDGKVANRQIGAATKARFESMIKPLL